MKNNLKDTEISENQDLLESAGELFNQKRFDEALSILDNIPKGCNEYTTALLMKSLTLGMMGKNDESYEFYKRFLVAKFGDFTGDFGDNEFDEDNPEELFLYGLGIFHIHNDYQRAIHYFNRSLKLNPDQSDVVYYKAISFACLGRFKSAVRIMDRAIEIDPKNAEYWNEKGLFLTQLNYTNKAHKAFDESIRIESNCDAWANKGVLYCKYDKFDKALYCFDKAISLDSTDIYSIVCKASIYSELKDFETADRYFREAERINPKDPMYLSERGKHFLNQSQFEKSIKYLDESLKIDAQMAWSWMYKSIALSELGRDKESESCFKKAIDLDPDSMSVFDEVLVIED